MAIGFRYILLKSKARECGSNVYCGSNVVIKNLAGISFGRNVSIHDMCYLDGAGKIVIGNDVSIAHASSLVSFEHTWDQAGVPIKYNPTRLSAIHIDDDVWVGCAVRILAGARIESRCVIGASAVVTGVCASGGVYVGAPSKRIREL